MAELKSRGRACDIAGCDNDAFYDLLDNHRRFCGSFCIIHGPSELVKADLREARRSEQARDELLSRKVGVRG